MSKIGWLTERVNANDGFFKATFDQKFVNAVNLEAAQLGAIVVGNNSQWTSGKLAFSLVAKNPKHIGGRGTVTLEVYLTDFNETVQAMQKLLDLARDYSGDVELLKKFQAGIANATR